MRSRPPRVFLATVFSIAVGHAWACSTPQEPAKGPPGGADANGDSAAASRDSGADSDGTCAWIGNMCSLDDLCCPPLIGNATDLARGCVKTEKIVLGCKARARGCVAEDAEGCFTRGTDDGGSEAFFTTSTWPDEQLPDLTRCPPDLQLRVAEAAKKACD